MFDLGEPKRNNCTEASYLSLTTRCGNVFPNLYIHYYSYKCHEKCELSIDEDDNDLISWDIPTSLFIYNCVVTDQLRV